MSKILVTVDGHCHAGMATAYLISRARDARPDDLLVVTVDPAEPGTAPSASPLAGLTSPAGTSGSVRAMADMAGPWLDVAGIECEFRGEVGDVVDVIIGLTKQEDIQEVVLVSDAPSLPAGVRNVFEWLGYGSAFHRLRSASSIPVSLVASPPATRSKNP